MQSIDGLTYVLEQEVVLLLHHLETGSNITPPVHTTNGLKNKIKSSKNSEINW